MSDCTQCADYERCAKNEECGMFKQKQMTNADRIRAMSDEELAEKFFLFPCVHVLDDKVKCKDDGCKKCWMRWLREECKNEN